MEPKYPRTPRVRWVQSALMVCYLALGLLSAVSHHLYYFSLHHGAVYSRGRQQWPIRIGSGLSALTIALFNFAIGAAYTQYVWMKLRSKTLSLSGIDHLFALLVDATGLFSKELIIKAKSVIVLALFAWLLPIAATISPATLSVASIVVPYVATTNVPTLQTNINKGWSVDTGEGEKLFNSLVYYWTPTAWVRQIVARAAVDVVIGDISMPGPNTSYSLVFPGPALQCNYATEIQENLFTYYKNNVTEDFQNTTDYDENPERLDKRQLVYNAFNPDDAPDNAFSENVTNTQAINSTGEEGFQFWIQTAQRNIVCLQGFSYFSAVFNWTNGTPDHQVTRLNFTTNMTDTTGWRLRVSSAVYLSLMDMISGNLTINKGHNMRLESEGSVMLTGLRGCDEIARNAWVNKTISATPEYIIGSGYAGMSASFPTNPWLCRNKTLAAALEDLSNNITMSLLGLDLTTQNNTVANVLFTPSQLVYEYGATNLILTYSIAGFISLIAMMFGFAAIDENGVAHSLKFSAIMDSTRSAGLAFVTTDCGLGMAPLGKEAEKTRLKFGALKSVVDGDEHRVGFVVADGDVPRAPPQT